MNKIAVIGAGGHTRALISILLNYFNPIDIGIYDDSFSGSSKLEYIGKIPLVGKIENIESNQRVIISTGDNALRKKYFQMFRKQLVEPSLIHPESIQEYECFIGNYNQIFAGSYIGAEVKVGLNNIINTSSVIEHESKVGNHNHISIGSILGGRCLVGDSCMIGAGAVILDNISICSNVNIGAGTVVICDINSEGTYVGNPARKVK